MKSKKNIGFRVLFYYLLRGRERERVLKKIIIIDAVIS